MPLTHSDPVIAAWVSSAKQNRVIYSERRSVEHILATELRVDVGPQSAPNHNATARAWLEFPNRPAGFQDYFDIENSQALWMELANLVMGAEGDLILAQSYKALEPSQEPDFNDNAALNRLYYIHDKKMALLNQAVYALIKVQDIVNRLIHESLGGDLVDTSKPNWQEDNLRRVKVLEGLERKRAASKLSVADFRNLKRPSNREKHTEGRSHQILQKSSHASRTPVRGLRHVLCKCELATWHRGW